MRRALLLLAVLPLVACGSHGGGAPAKNWTRVSTPTLPGGSSRLAGVSCVSSSFCVAVGDTFLRPLVSHTLVERWDGSAWQPLATNAAPDDHSGLTAVSCVSTSSCVAVGSHFTGFAPHGLVETWDGSSWHVAGDAGPATPHILSGISCAGDRFCAAVGMTRTTPARALVETWDGTAWQLAQIPARETFTSLSGVSCTSATFCVAVGQQTRGQAVEPVALVWNGTAWAFEAAPPAGSLSSLAGASCVSTDWCFAVGGRQRGIGTSTLVERRTQAWELRPSPRPTFMNGFLAVSCVSQSACAAVGAEHFEANRTLIAVWDGDLWTVVAAPNPKGSNTLTAVSCTHGGAFCFAVGSTGATVGIASTPLVIQAG